MTNSPPEVANSTFMMAALQILVMDATRPPVLHNLITRDLLCHVPTWTHWPHCSHSPIGTSIHMQSSKTHNSTCLKKYHPDLSFLKSERLQDPRGRRCESCSLPIHFSPTHHRSDSSTVFYLQILSGNYFYKVCKNNVRVLIYHSITVLFCFGLSQRILKGL